MNKAFLILLILSVYFFNTFSSVAAIDSLRVEVINGKKFIVHKVDPKETLYALSKRYHVTVDDIRNNNEAEKDGYSIDQIGRILYIPLFSDISNNTIVEPQQTTRKHIVKAGETLYSLSRKYGVKVSDLKEWNDLKSSQLALGQELIVSKGQETASVEKNNEATSQENVEHKVEAGETIYSISKKYGVSQDELKKWNNLESSNIALGQILIVKKEKSTDESGENTNKSGPKNEYVRSSVQEFHIAKSGETYADIAEQYNIKLDELESWNVFEEPFKGGEVIHIVEKSVPPTLKEGNAPDDSKKHIVKSGETLYSIADKYEVDIEDIRKWNNLEMYQLKLGQELYVKNPDDFEVESEVKEEVQIQKEEKPDIDVVKIAADTPKQDTKAYFTVEEEDIPEIEKVVEKGIAEVIEGSDNTEKHLALHRTAKIGTIMQVRNDLNDQIVFVRVLGKLPDTGVDDKVIIRISKKAFQRLGGVDYKFPVEISYLPLDD